MSLTQTNSEADDVDKYASDAHVAHPIVGVLQKKTMS